MTGRDPWSETAEGEEPLSRLDREKGRERGRFHIPLLNRDRAEQGDAEPGQDADPPTADDVSPEREDTPPAAPPRPEAKQTSDPDQVTGQDPYPQNGSSMAGDPQQRLAGGRAPAELADPEAAERPVPGQPTFTPNPEWAHTPAYDGNTRPPLTPAPLDDLHVPGSRSEAVLEQYREPATPDAPPVRRDPDAGAHPSAAPRPPVADRPQIQVTKPAPATALSAPAPTTEFPEPPVIGKAPRYAPFFTGALPESRAVTFGEAVPDTALDGADLTGLTVRGASLRGDRHRYTKEVRQDAMGIWQIGDGVTDALLVCAADGVSSQWLSHAGAAQACSLLRDHAAPKVSKFFRADGDAWVTDLWEDLADVICREMNRYAAGLRIDPKELSTTLAAALIELKPANPERRRYVILNVGDARAFLLREGEFLPCLPEAHASSDAITSTATSALPTSVGNAMTARGVLGPDDMLMVCSDGMSDPMANGPVRDTLAGWWGGERIPSVPEYGWQAGYRVASYDDDRTAVCVWGRNR